MLLKLSLVVALAVGGALPEAAADPAPAPSVADAAFVTRSGDDRPEAVTDEAPVDETGVPADEAGEVTQVPLDDVLVEVPDVAELAAPTPAPSAGTPSPTPAPTAAAAPGAVVSDVVETDGFQMLGVTWPDDQPVEALEVQVRTRQDERWSDWQPLEVGDEAPDAGTPDADEARRSGTDPLWVGESDAVQVSLRSTGDAVPSDLELALVDVPEVDTPAPDAQVRGAATSGDVLVQQAAYSTPTALTSQPAVITRAQWGARAQRCTPDVATSLVGAVVHHTAGPNGYSSVADAMRQIRGDQAYHMDARGWCDLGYNVVVDKWGNTYEGRAGSLSKAVIGVHAGGFNTGTLGVAMLGSYEATPSAATRASVARIIAWRLQASYLDPGGSMRYTTNGGENSRFSGTTTVTLPRIFGHRDVSYTACPGTGGYGALPDIRNRARAYVSPSFVSPSRSASSVARAGSVRVTAGAVGSVAWTLTVTDARTGVRVATRSGTTASSVSATWDTRNGSGQVVGAGPYRLTLTGRAASGGGTARSWSTTVQVTGSTNPATVASVPLAGDLQYVPVTPVRVLDTRPGAQSLGSRSRVDVKVAGVSGVPTGARAVAVTVTAVHPTATTYVTAWPAGAVRPATSTVNVDPSRAAAAGAVVGVGGDGRISLYNNAGSTHLVADVTGYFVPSSGTRYSQLASAARLMDTRDVGGTMRSGQRRTITVAGRSGIPAGATAVIANVTSVGAAGDGYVSVVPAGTALGSTSSVNHLRGTDVSNRVVVPLSGGKADVYLAGGAADVLVDVVGWFGPGGTLTFTPMQPVRAFDTRAAGGALGSGSVRSFAVGRVSGVPSDAQAALVNVTAAGQTARTTFVTAWPADDARPGTSDLNTGAGRDQANVTVVGWDAQGRSSLFNNAGRTHLIGDVYGYFAP